MWSAVAAALLTGALGFGGGYLVADDAGTVDDLKAEQSSLEDQIGDLAEEIEALEVAAEGSAADLAEFAADVTQLATSAEQLSDAFVAWMEAPIGSEAEAEAGREMDRLLLQLPGDVTTVRNALEQLEG